MGLGVVVHRKARLVLLACACFSISGCAWYGALEGIYERRNSEANGHEINPKDEYMQQFYDLHRRVEQLEHKRSPESSVEDKADHDFDRQAEQAIQYIKSKTQEAIANIEGLINRLTSSAQQPDVAEQGAQVNVHVSDSDADKLCVRKGASETNPAGIDRLIGIEHDKIVNGLASDNRYNYSVVYVYPEKQSWLAMWTLLNDAKISDKWRGKNQTKNTYFIYVGAYYTTKRAEERRRNLLALTGHSPEIRSKIYSESVVLK